MERLAIIYVMIGILMQTMAVLSKKEQIDVLVRHVNGHEEWVKILPKRVGKRSMLGVVPIESLDVNEKEPTQEKSPAREAEDYRRRQVGARVNGQSIRLTNYPQLTFQIVAASQRRDYRHRSQRTKKSEKGIGLTNLNASTSRSRPKAR